MPNTSAQRDKEHKDFKRLDGQIFSVPLFLCVFVSKIDLIYRQFSDLPKLSRFSLDVYNIPDDNSFGIYRGHSTSSSYVNNDGSFTLKGIYLGKIRIELRQFDKNHLFQIDHIKYNSIKILPNRIYGIDIVPGMKISDVRIILHRQDSLQIHGEIKIINGTLPENVQLVPLIRKVTPESPHTPFNSISIDARNKFSIEQLSEGEYEVALNFGFKNNDGNTNENIKLQLKAQRARKKVTVTKGSTQTVVLTVDLGSKN